MSCCKDDCLQPVADAAVYFMEERKSEKAVRESPDRPKLVEGHVTIEDASFLLVKFDDRSVDVGGC